jgi:hypothetical protein
MASGLKSGSCGSCVLHQFLYGIRKLGAFAGPIVDALTFEVDCGRGSAGIVSTNHFYGAAIAGTILFNDYDTVIRLLAGAKTRQTNHQHSFILPFNPESFVGVFLRGGPQPSAGAHNSQRLSIAGIRIQASSPGKSSTASLKKKLAHKIFGKNRKQKSRKFPRAQDFYETKVFIRTVNKL